ncbi:hypothetical protein [Falsigemmobacter faecalis]|uniref:Uncharacterized protein n=1 Tax=Falsigemmobacter faecalis TaxID=2488730 RepID=A0A3P3DEA7_9RHOB|nr:hypothetical protein [Falsigemmobacter faecalis]RRH72629.1 hypothetical protein EG244_14445 [Falsigemmobacter faecalis]
MSGKILRERAGVIAGITGVGVFGPGLQVQEAQVSGCVSGFYEKAVLVKGRVGFSEVMRWGKVAVVW